MAIDIIIIMYGLERMYVLRLISVQLEIIKCTIIIIIIIIIITTIDTLKLQ